MRMPVGPRAMGLQTRDDADGEVALSRERANGGRDGASRNTRDLAEQAAAIETVRAQSLGYGEHHLPTNLHRCCTARYLGDPRLLKPVVLGETHSTRYAVHGDRPFGVRRGDVGRSPSWFCARRDRPRHLRVCGRRVRARRASWEGRGPRDAQRTLRVACTAGTATPALDYPRCAWVVRQAGLHRARATGAIHGAADPARVLTSGRRTRVAHKHIAHKRVTREGTSRTSPRACRVSACGLAPPKPMPTLGTCNGAA